MIWRGRYPVWTTSCGRDHNQYGRQVRRGDIVYIMGQPVGYANHLLARAKQNREERQVIFPTISQHPPSDHFEPLQALSPVLSCRVVLDIYLRPPHALRRGSSPPTIPRYPLRYAVPCVFPHTVLFSRKLSRERGPRRAQGLGHGRDLTTVFRAVARNVVF